MDTPDRDDANWLKTTLATYQPTGPSFEFEPIDCRYIAPRARKYRINQNKVVKEILGEEALQGVGEAKPVEAQRL
jgi:succinate dehydrogenase / fumarate reductase flavoprotein subunit